LLDDDARTQQFGRDWTVEGRSAVRAVRFAVVPAENNYVINPNHPSFQFLEFRDPLPLRLDPRLFQK
jgi:RES domain-containing protein